MRSYHLMSTVAHSVIDQSGASDGSETLKGMAALAALTDEKDAAKDVQRLRNMFFHSKGRMPRMTDDAIAQLIVDSDDDQDDDEWIADMLEAEEPVSPEKEDKSEVSKDVAQSLNAQALGFASKVDAALATEIKHVMKIRRDLASAPIVIMQHLARIYGADMDAWPVPNTEAGDVSGNEPFDRYSTRVTDTVNGGTKKIKGSFYNTLFDATPSLGKDILDELALIDKAKDKNLAPKDRPEKYRAYTAIQLKSIRGDFTTDQATGRKLLRDAMKLYLQLKAVRELPLIEVQFSRHPDFKPEPSTVSEIDGKKYALVDGVQRPLMTNGMVRGEIRRATSPILLYQREAPGSNNRVADMNETKSIPQFLRLKPREAETHGGTLEALLNSADSVVTTDKTNETPDAAGDFPQVNVVNVDTATARYATAWEDVSIRAAINKLVRSKDGEAMLISIGELRGQLNALFQDEKIASRYEALQIKLSDKELAEKKTG